MAAPMNKIFVTKKLKNYIKLLEGSDVTDPESKEIMNKYLENSCDTISFPEIVHIRDKLKEMQGDGDKITVPYLHELLDGCKLEIPGLVIPTRNPQLEARCQKLKAEQANKDYAIMTKNVDLKSRSSDLRSFGEEVKHMNNSLIAVFNFTVTVGGAFAFAYKATEYSMHQPNVPIQLCMGMVFGTLVFFADLYFLLKQDL